MSSKFIEVTVDGDSILVNIDDILSVVALNNGSSLELRESRLAPCYFVKETYSEIKEKLLCS